MRKDISKEIGLFFLFIIFVFTTSAYAAIEEAGQVLAVKRDAFIIREAEKNRAEPATRLLLKDAVETGVKSRAKLFFIDDSILNLGQLSRLEVEEYIYSPERKRSRSIYRLVNGSLRVVVGRSDLEVHTVTAVAAARGTKFFIWTEGERGLMLAGREKYGKKRRRSTCIVVLEGKVSLRNKDPKIKGEIMISEGNSGCVMEGEPPEDMGEADKGIVDELSREMYVFGPIKEEISELPAFIPPATVFVPDVPVDPPITQEPEVPEAEVIEEAVTPEETGGGVDVEVVFP